MFPFCDGTFGQRLHHDLLAVVSVSGRCHGHHPDAVLPVASQIGNSVEVGIGRRLKLAHHLWEARHRGASCTNRASPDGHREEVVKKQAAGALGTQMLIPWDACSSRRRCTSG